MFMPAKKDSRSSEKQYSGYMAKEILQIRFGELRPTDGSYSMTRMLSFSIATASPIASRSLPSSTYNYDRHFAWFYLGARIIGASRHEVIG